MNHNIITYYVPQNLNITKGKIYNLYINRIKNLDLTSISQPKKEETITLNKSDLTKIIELLNNQKRISIQAQEIENKLVKERK